MDIEKIKALWIFDNEGFCLFSYPPGISDKSHLVSGFMAAINAFGDVLGTGDIRNFKMKEDQFVVLRDSSTAIFFMVQADFDLKLEIIDKIIKKIQHKFISRYKKQLNGSHWGCADIFTGFNPFG